MRTNNNMWQAVMEASVLAAVRTETDVMAEKARDLMAQLMGTESLLTRCGVDSARLRQLKESIRAQRSILEGVVNNLNNI